MTVQTPVSVQLAPDPVLPCRDALLDDAVMAERLGVLLDRSTSLPGTSLHGISLPGTSLRCTRVRAKYRIGESLRVTFHVPAASMPQIVSARMFPAATAGEQFARASAAARRADAPPRSVLFDADLGTVFWVFPQDRKLRGLDRLTDPDPSLRDVFGIPWARGRLVAYSPEKAATARCTDESGTVIGYAKVAVDDDGARSVEAHRRAARGLDRDGALHLPRAIAYLGQHHMAFYTAAPGVPLNTVPRGDVPAAMAALGTALAVLHRQPQQGFAPFVRLEPSRVQRSAELVRTARPDVAAAAEAAAAALLRSVPAPRPSVLLHGDLHPKNVLVHDSGVSLVDLDQAGTGPAEAEIGALLARLWWPRSTDGVDPATAATAADALLGGYATDLDEHALRWYAAAALLVERAVRAVNRVDSAALTELSATVDTARTWAEQLPATPPRTREARP